LSNFGVFGATIGTPIINQPNVGILGTGVIKKQPVVIEKNDLDIIAIRQMMMLSLGFDHRLIDGAGGALFLSKIKNILENFNFENILIMSELIQKPYKPKIKLQIGENYKFVNNVVKNYNLNTVCAEANCPNIYECWNRGYSYCYDTWRYLH
jgi:hypothetical protein